MIDIQIHHLTNYTDSTTIPGCLASIKPNNTSATSTTQQGNYDYQIMQKCGIFQVKLVLLLIGPRIISGMCLYFMVFGAYNPGWRCLDVVNDKYDYQNNNGVLNETIIASSNVTNKSDGYLFDSCEVFESCQRVEFNPATSTLVTEWGLLCDRAWIPALITSVMMAGLPVGTMFLGYFGDRFGRKWTIYINVLLLGILELISMYSINWEMFTVIRFLMGVLCGILIWGPVVLTSEFIPPTWRPANQGVPTWNCGILAFCVCALITKNWETIHLITAIIAFLSFLPCVWVPESLRWLITNGKREPSKAVIKKIVKVNKIDLPENIDELLETGYVKGAREIRVKATFMDLLRKRFKLTAIFAICCFSIELIYFASHFSVSIFPGNIFVNMIIMSASEFPSNIISAFLPNFSGRRKSLVLSLLLGSLGFTGVAIIEMFASYDIRLYSILVLVAVAKNLINVALKVLHLQVVEIYPTVLRSTAVGFIGFCSGIGSIVAPYLIPASEETLYINFFVAGALLIVCVLLGMQIPETKGKPLADTWEDDSINL